MTDCVPATPLRRGMALLLDGLLATFTLLIGWFVWWLFIMAEGKTPGKQLLELRSVRADGMPLGAGMTFLRELLKGFVHGTAIGFIADLIFIVQDDQEHRSLVDKIVETKVVYEGS